jgi:hypothetical protein
LQALTETGQAYGYVQQAAEGWWQEAEILRRLCNGLAKDMGVLLVPVRENTGAVHAGADGFSGTAVSHNGKRQGPAADGQPVHHRPAFEKRQEKLALKGKSGTRPGKLLKKQIPVRTYYADADKKPGFFEIDTVHHCGTSDSGECGL